MPRRAHALVILLCVACPPWWEAPEAETSPLPPGSISVSGAAGTSPATSTDSSTGAMSTAEPTDGVASTNPNTTEPMGPKLDAGVDEPESTGSSSGANSSASSTSTSGPNSTSDPGSSSSSTATTNPPGNDPQPATGLYSNCFPDEMCSNLPGTGGCFTIVDQDMVEFDGFCTILCQTEADCAPKPKSPAITRCLNYDPNDPTTKACFLKCTRESDCPVGMACELVALPVGDGNYCW